MDGLTGILVCGGKSTRMGTDKKLLKIGNQLLIDRLLLFLKETCSEILISNNDDKLDSLNYPVIRDQVADIGPMGGVYSCLNYSSSNLNFVLACDMPLVTGKLLRKMLSLAHNHQAVIPVYNNRPHPLYGLYNKSIAPLMKQQIDKENYSLQKLLKQIDVFYLKTDSLEASELVNMNTPTEYLAYEQMSRALYG